MSPHWTDNMDETSSSNGAHSVTSGAETPEAYTSAPAVQALNGIDGSMAPNLADGPAIVGGNVPRAVNGVNGNAKQSTRGGRHSGVQKSQYLKPSEPDATYDLVCVGFGPASVAVAIALHDALEAGSLTVAPRVLFLEKQTRFAWHAGMLLPGAKMQISFIKDLASLRDPRSHFTFLNYLHKNDRLIDFTNLSTFLPARAEFEDYLRWCASHFDHVVQYNNQVLSVSPVPEPCGPLQTFAVTSRNLKTGVTTSYRSRNVILALGGQPSMPRILPTRHPRVIHSSQYAQRVPELLTDPLAPYRVAVIGAGQSAAEIFDNVQNLYPNSKTCMVMRSEFLKPSDDSPFVNSIFNPTFVDHIYSQSSTYRRNLLEDARATNYSVVRLELIEHLYEKMYHQKRTLGSDETQWPHRIVAGAQLVGAEEAGDALRIKLASAGPECETRKGAAHEETLEVDLVICATGYQRSAHVDMLRELAPLLPVLDAPNPELCATSKERWLLEPDSSAKSAGPRILEVGRNYGVYFSSGAVATGSGVWLQGCCEATHGLSDTLLSVLSTRSGEMVESIFGAATDSGYTST